MSKVGIVGPRQLLGETLALVRQKGDLQIEPSAVGFVDDIHKRAIHSMLPDEKALFEKIFLEKLDAKLNDLFACLPAETIRESFLTPRPIIDTVSRKEKQFFPKTVRNVKNHRSEQKTHTRNKKVV